MCEHVHCSGGLFGAAYNPTCTLPSATMLDFYQGGAVGVACLGAAEVDSQGNVNVSNFGARRRAPRRRRGRVECARAAASGPRMEKETKDFDTAKEY